jgi:mono/diheme cytochrome c family protein
MRIMARVALWSLAMVACGPTPKDGEHGALVRIDVEPANATITHTAAPVTLEYTAIGHYEDGTEGVIPDATFSLDVDGSRLGEIAAATFSTTGRAAGKGGVIAQAEDITGATSVIVLVHPTNLGPGVPADAATRFPDVSPPGAMSQTIVYPLDSAVMPTSVRAPNVQWEGSSTGPSDLYRVRLSAGFATVDTILAGAPTNVMPSADDWLLLKTTIGTGPIAVSVDHWDEVNGAQGGAPVQMKMIAADIAGAIYYWNLEAGRMDRIDAMGHGLAIENPPPRPGDSAKCVACHTVSRDGRYLSGSLWDAGQQGAVFDMSDPTVRTGNPAPTVAPLSTTTYTTLFTTFNADATRLLVNVGTGFNLVDPHSGASVATQGTPLPTSGVSHPTWSPDGSSIAFINNITSGGGPASWAVDYDRGDLHVIPVTATDTFGPAVPVVPAASVDAAFAAPSWPSFAPDSNWIAYGAGVFSRGKNGPTEHPGSLFLVNKAGGITTRLDNACGGARRCYLPNFSPYDAGGYFWLIYYSFKDYGNATVGTKGTGRRQMWITAIDKSKLGTGQDPSSVPYWVPDQDSTTQNMSAFWSLPPPIQ